MRDDSGVRMTLAEHLEELRVRLLRCLLILLIAIAGSMVFYRSLVAVATLPHFRAMEWCGLSHEHSKLLMTTYIRSTMAVLKLGLIAAVVVASPLIAREAWGFVAAGLRKEERRWVLRLAPLSFLLFLLGCAFGYFLLIPWTLYGMARMMPSEQVQLLVDFGEYIGLLLTLTILLGAVFQLPLLMAFLTSIGMIPASRWSQWRRGAVVGNLVLSAVLSPPEVLSMVAFCIPLLLLYEVGVAASHLLGRRLPAS